MSSSLRQALRSETAERHRQLDEQVGDFGFFESLDSYHVYLRWMGSLHAAYADSVDYCAEQAGLPKWSDQIQEWIAADVGSEVQSVSKGAQIERQEAVAWGSAYVLEGSSMGIRYLVKQLHEKLPGASTHYVEQIAEASGKRWPTFIKALEAAEIDHDQTVAAACAAFDHASHLVSKLKSEH